MVAQLGLLEFKLDIRDAVLFLEGGTVILCLRLYDSPKRRDEKLTR